MGAEELKVLSCKVSPEIHARIKSMAALARKSATDLLAEIVIEAVGASIVRERALIIEEQAKLDAKKIV